MKPISNKNNSSSFINIPDFIKQYPNLSCYLKDHDLEARAIIINEQSCITINEDEDQNIEILRTIIVLCLRGSTVNWNSLIKKSRDELVKNYLFIVERDGQINFNQSVITGCDNKINIELILHGTRAEGSINASYALNNNEKIVYGTTQIHKSPDCRSSLSIRGVLADKSQSDFTGIIRIEEESKQSTASQQQKTILLSNNAVSNAKPQLEINNNMVRCRHGSASGQLDHEQLFYMQSRGIIVNQAKKILLRNFLNATIGSDFIEKKLNQILDD